MGFPLHPSRMLRGGAGNPIGVLGNCHDRVVSTAVLDSTLHSSSTKPSCKDNGTELTGTPSGFPSPQGSGPTTPGSMPGASPRCSVFVDGNRRYQHGKYPATAASKNIARRFSLGNHRRRTFPRHLLRKAHARSGTTPNFKQLYADRRYCDNHRDM
jgi:hypothetical protein